MNINNVYNMFITNKYRTFKFSDSLNLFKFIKKIKFITVFTYSTIF